MFWSCDWSQFCLPNWMFSFLRLVWLVKSLSLWFIDCTNFIISAFLFLKKKRQLVSLMAFRLFSEVLKPHFSTCLSPSAVNLFWSQPLKQDTSRFSALVHFIKWHGFVRSGCASNVTLISSAVVLCDDDDDADKTRHWQQPSLITLCRQFSSEVSVTTLPICFPAFGSVKADRSDLCCDQ